MRRCTCAALAVLLAIVVRWCVALNGYSGAGKPPMFGDYEAQRHWQEITLNLPVREWYFNSTRNDLLYWGLDYPPLTAYHSLLCGYVARWFDRRWVELGESRGHEGMEHKMFMRATVMLADVFVFIPAVVLCCLWGARDSWRRKMSVCVCTLLYPGIILIDHGHFQYNGVSLGLSLWASLALLHGRPLLASVAFCLSLAYKQMQLYHAPAFFCFLLARCIHSRPRTRGLLLLLRLAITVIATLAVCSAPFLSDPQQLLQILARIFPVSRGLYESAVDATVSLAVVFPPPAIPVSPRIQTVPDYFISLVLPLLLSSSRKIHPPGRYPSLPTPLRVPPGCHLVPRGFNVQHATLAAERRAAASHRDDDAGIHGRFMGPPDPKANSALAGSAGCFVSLHGDAACRELPRVCACSLPRPLPRAHLGDFLFPLPRVPGRLHCVARADCGDTRGHPEMRGHPETRADTVRWCTATRRETLGAWRNIQGTR
ncbi:dolichyl pyrophosphate Man9GlcNAc2 alpha-1,3-glucosyltransferase isoform X2 [Lampetra fluviatilis]